MEVVVGVHRSRVDILYSSSSYPSLKAAAPQAPVEQLDQLLVGHRAHADLRLRKRHDRPGELARLAVLQQHVAQPEAVHRDQRRQPLLRQQRQQQPGPDRQEGCGLDEALHGQRHPLHVVRLRQPQQHARQRLPRRPLLVRSDRAARPARPPGPLPDTKTRPHKGRSAWVCLQPLVSAPGSSTGTLWRAASARRGCRRNRRGCSLRRSCRRP